MQAIPVRRVVVDLSLSLACGSGVFSSHTPEGTVGFSVTLKKKESLVILARHQTSDNQETTIWRPAIWAVLKRPG